MAANPDYLRMGVPEVWVLDPERKHALVVQPNAEIEVREGGLEFRGIQLPLTALFEAAG